MLEIRKSSGTKGPGTGSLTDVRENEGKRAKQKNAMNDPNDDFPWSGGPAPFCFPKRGVSRVAARHQGVLHGGRRTGRHLGIASQYLFTFLE